MGSGKGQSRTGITDQRALSAPFAPAVLRIGSMRLQY